MYNTRFCFWKSMSAFSVPPLGSSDSVSTAHALDLVIVQITWNKGRTVEQKKALYKVIADGLAASPSLRREDVFIRPGRGQT
jgi:hypothetical protein